MYFSGKELIFRNVTFSEFISLDKNQPIDNYVKAENGNITLINTKITCVNSQPQIYYNNF